METNKMKEKCRCNEMMWRNEDLPVYVHLLGCPEDFQTKEYDSLKWWQKLFKTNPRKYLH